MTHQNMSAYGLWWLVIFNSALFIIFAFSFTHPRTKRDWRSFSAFSAFILALFTEMYGFPLTIYLLSGWLGNHYPGVNIYSHNGGHLWHTLFGLNAGVDVRKAGSVRGSRRSRRIRSGLRRIREDHTRVCSQLFDHAFC